MEKKKEKTDTRVTPDSPVTWGIISAGMAVGGHGLERT